MILRTALCSLLLVSSLPLSLSAQAHQPTAPPPAKKPIEDAGAVTHGRTLYQSSCGFCHGPDATGSRAPDLVRSSVTLKDEKGDRLGPVIRNGRPDKGMPAFPNLTDDQIGNIAAFLHHQANAALHSAGVPRDYPVTKLLTGSAGAGKEYFTGAGGCSGCHSPTGDLAGVAKRFSAVDLQQRLVYPASKHPKKTATVTIADGTRFEGQLQHDDEFTIALTGQDGWYHSWPKSDVKVEVHDPLSAHRDLMGKYTDRDMHNLFAYLETLK